MKFHVVVLLFGMLLFQICRAQANGEPVSPTAVDAPALIREVLAKESWLLDANSFHVRAISTYSKSPQAIIELTHDLALEFPDAIITPERFSQLLPQSSTTLELAFTKDRLFFDERDLPNFERACLYDGSKTTLHDVDRSRDRDIYRRSSISACDLVWVFRWPQRDFHTSWWDKTRGKPASSDPKPEDFAFIRREMVAGSECYVLGLRGHNLERWSVGIEDHLLHRIERGSIPTDQEMLDAYHDAARADGVELEVVEDILPWLESLSEEKAEAISLQCLWKLYATAKAPIQDMLTDYRQIAPGCWYPFAQQSLVLGYRVRGNKPVKEDWEHPWIRSKDEIHIIDATVNQPIADTVFRLSIPKGASIEGENSAAPVVNPGKHETSP